MVEPSKRTAVRRYGNFIEYDLAVMMEGNYWYTVCTSRWFMSLRRRFAPHTLRYEERYEPPHRKLGEGLTFPLWNMIERQPSASSLHESLPPLIVPRDPNDPDSSLWVTLDSEE